MDMERMVERASKTKPLFYKKDAVEFYRQAGRLDNFFIKGQIDFVDYCKRSSELEKYYNVIPREIHLKTSKELQSFLEWYTRNSDYAREERIRMEHFSERVLYQVELKSSFCAVIMSDGMVFPTTMFYKKNVRKDYNHKNTLAWEIGEEKTRKFIETYRAIKDDSVLFNELVSQ